MPPVQYDQAVNGTITPAGAMGSNMLNKVLTSTLNPTGTVGKGLFLAAMTLAGTVGAITGSMGAKYLIPFIRGLVGFTQHPRSSTTAPDQRLPNLTTTGIMNGAPVVTLMSPGEPPDEHTQTTVAPDRR